MEPGRIFYGRHDRTLVMKLQGDVRYGALDAPVDTTALDAFIEHLVCQGGVEDVVIDLTETGAIDSTHLGLLAQLGVLLQEEQGRRATVVSPVSRITDILRTMALDQLFYVVDAAPRKADELTVLEGDGAAPDAASAVVLKAHRILAALNENNREAFRNLIHVLEQEHPSGGERQ